MNKLSLSKYQLQISKLNTLKESKFVYDISRWSNLNEGCKRLISDFEGKYVSRADVIKTYKEYYANKGDVLKAFTLTMVWGFADTGYGTHRTNVYLAAPTNISLIKKAIDSVKQNDLNSAFEHLKKIKGLGVSYISKILYFASRSVNQSNYALIYDIRVATSLVQLTTPKEIFQIVKINPSSKFEEYEKYNKLIHNLASKHKLEAEAIELFLFNQEF